MLRLVVNYASRKPHHGGMSHTIYAVANFAYCIYARTHLPAKERIHTLSLVIIFSKYYDPLCEKLTINFAFLVSTRAGFHTECNGSPARDAQFLEKRNVEVVRTESSMFPYRVTYMVVVILSF